MSDAKTITAALVKFQAALKPARKDATNPHLKNKYATLAAVWEALADPLEANGLMVLQPVKTDGGSVEVSTIILHESGERMEFPPLKMPVGEKATAQAVGSAISYARRYALSSLLGVVAEDDDGHAASHRPTPPPRPPPAPSVAALKSKVAAALKPESMSPLEKMLAHGKEHGLSDTQTKAAIKSALGKPQVNPSELTDADVFTVAKFLQTEREANAQ